MTNFKQEPTIRLLMILIFVKEAFFQSADTDAQLPKVLRIRIECPNLNGTSIPRYRAENHHKVRV